MKRNHKVECFHTIFEGQTSQRAYVLTHNGKLAAECRSLRMARKIAKALDAFDAQRRSLAVEEST